MDATRRNLYFSVMASSRPSAPPPLPAASGVPAYFLYGEPLQPPDERLIHIETIAARSRLHDWHIRPHRHRDLHQVLLIQRGSVESRLDGSAATLQAPLAITVPPGVVHSFRFRSETVGVVISFAATLARELQPPSAGGAALLERSRAVALHRGALGRTDLRQLAAMLLREHGRSAPGRRAALRGLLAAFLANLQRLMPDDAAEHAPAGVRERELVARFRELVESRFRQHAGIADYTQSLQTSASRLLRACMAVTGDSPIELVHLRLVVEAERQLRYTSMSVTQIAYYLGFEDPAYFSRFFTRRMGISPRAFRRRDALTVLVTGQT